MFLVDNAFAVSSPVSQLLKVEVAHAFRVFGLFLI